MGFFFSDKGSIISDMFQLVEDHANLEAGWAYEVLVCEDCIRIKQKAGGKAEASLRYSQITDVFYGTRMEIREKKQSPIGRALVGGFLFGGAGAIVGAMTADKKQTKEKHLYFIISYKSSRGEDRYIQFEDTRKYKGAKVAAKLIEKCNLRPTSRSKPRSVEL